MYDCSFLYNTYACVHAYMIYVCTRYSTCVHILLTQYMHIYTHMCACMCARNEMYPKYMHAYVYMHHTQISRYHHSIHQQNAPRACVCVYVCVCVCVCVSCIRPRASKSHASCLANSSSWSKHLGGQTTCFFPHFFLLLSHLTNSCLGNGKARAHAVKRGADSAQQRRQGLMQAQSSFLLAYL
jgi:hypothetical protein